MRNWFIFDKKSSYKVTVFNYVLFFFVFILIFRFFPLNSDYNFSWNSILEYKSFLIRGFLSTIWISLVALVISLLMGILIAVGQMSSIIFVRIFFRSIMEIFRGTPLLVQLLVFYYILADALGINNRLMIGILVLSLFEGSYISEIIRAGIESIGKTQRETALTIGLNNFQLYRYIIFPQLITKLLPSIAGQFSSIIKDSSLLYVISISEFTMSATQVNNYTFSTIEAFLVLAVGYFLLTFPISILARYLEKKYHYDV